MPFFLIENICHLLYNFFLLLFVLVYMVFLIIVAVVLLQMDKENEGNLKHTFYSILGDLGFGYSL